MSGVGIHEMAPPGVEDGVEAGDEHVGWYAGDQRLVDLGQYLTWRGGVQGPGGELKHAAGGGHNKSGGHPLPCCVAHDHSQPPLGEEVEVVEVAPYLSSRLVEGRDLPALQGGAPPQAARHVGCFVPP